MRGKGSHKSRRSHRVALWVVNLTEFLRKGSHRFNGFNRNVYSVDSCNSWLVILMQISHKFELCENRLFPVDGGEEVAVCHGGEDGHDGVDEDEQVVADAVAEIEGEGAYHGVDHKQK